MKMLGIEEHADKQVKNLSGGTKRKLAYAITLFGNANIVLLDGKCQKKITFSFYFLKLFKFE